MGLESLISQLVSQLYPVAFAAGARLRRDWVVRATRPLPTQAVLSVLQNKVEEGVFETIISAYSTSATAEQLAGARPSVQLTRLDDLHLVVRTEFAGPETTVGDVAAIAQLGALQKIDREIEFDELQGLPADWWFWLRASREAPEGG